MRRVLSNGGYTHLVRNYGRHSREPVFQMDGMVIYRSWNGSSYNDSFSKDAYADIHDLTKKNLKECFSDNPKFLELIENNDWKEVYRVNGQLKWKVVDLYKQSLQK